MNILFVYAHPEPTSLNASLKNFAIEQLEATGHQVQVSDLYAMQWKATLDERDRLDFEKGAVFSPSMDSMKAFQAGTQSPDIAKEQEKLLWADTVIFQFPIWWFSMPAIMKGWVERVYAFGFAYGVGEHSDKHWGDRYGQGTLKGKRAMLLVSAGGWESHYSDRGINGSIDDLLFPIHHGILYYPGFDVLPPFVVYQTNRMDEARYADVCEELKLRLAQLDTIEPIAFRSQNMGDYDIPALTLKPHIKPKELGFSIHIKVPTSLKDTF